MTKKKLIISSIFIIFLGVALWLFLINYSNHPIESCPTVLSSRKNMKKCEVKGTYQIDGATVYYVTTTDEAVGLCSGGDCELYEDTKNLLVESNGNIISIMGPEDYTLLSRIERAFPFCGENLIIEDENVSIPGKLTINLTKNNEKYFWKYNFSDYKFSDCKLNGTALLGISDKKSDLRELKATFMSSEIMDCDNNSILDKMCLRMNTGLLSNTCNASSKTDIKKEVCLVAKAMYENNSKICQGISQNYAYSVSCYANAAFQSADENICKQVKSTNLFAPTSLSGDYCFTLYRYYKDNYE